MSPVASELVASLLQPISAAHPCGALLDIDVDADLLWIQDEIEKTGAFGSGEVDWAGILDKSSRLFSGRSKDWSLACYIVRAMYHVDGYAGLRSGLEFLRESAQRYWKEMHPSPTAGLRKRVNVLEWLIAGLADDLARKPAAATAGDGPGAARELLGTLDALLGDSLGPAYAGSRLLREALQKQERQSSPPPEAPARETGPAPAAAPTAAAPAEFPPAIDTSDVADSVLSKCRQGIFAACDVLQAQDPADPRPYRLRRLAAWMNFSQPPPAEEGQIAAPGPDEGEAVRLRGVLSADPKGVLLESEGRLQAYPLWLDLQHLACLALERLGPPHQAAGQVVAQETQAFLRRLPGLMELQFSNGVPLADPATCAWIAEELREGQSAEAPAAEPADGRLGEAVARAAELAGGGDVQKSLEIFDEGLRTIAAGRERFRWRLAAARHCARFGQTGLALDLLEGLDREAAERDLELWEPDLCADVLQAALQLGAKGRARKGPPLPMVIERIPQLNRRLARLDLLAALRTSTKER